VGTLSVSRSAKSLKRRRTGGASSQRGGRLVRGAVSFPQYSKNQKRGVVADPKSCKGGESLMVLRVGGPPQGAAKVRAG